MMRHWTRWRRARRLAAIRRLAAAAPGTPDAPTISLIGDPVAGDAAEAEVVADLADADCDWVGRSPPGGAPDPQGLKLVRNALAAHPDAQMIFTDEAAADGRLFLKPGFDPVLQSGLDYVSGFVLFRRARLLERCAPGTPFDPAALIGPYAADLGAAEILHLPYPAVVSPDPWPTPQAQAQIRPARTDKISIVIPNRNSPKLIAVTLAGVLEDTDYPNLEVVVVDNGSTDPQTLALYEARAGDPRFRVKIREAAFNFSAMVNRGMALASGDHVLLMNNDIEVREPGWLAEMAACLDAGAGIVGARLLFPGGRLQHAGVGLGLNGRAEHLFYGAPGDHPGAWGELAVRRSASVVTAAAMLISGPCLADLGGFDEETFAVAYNDVDFCARARSRGWSVVYTPHATLIHHEGASRRGNAAARARFQAELAALRTRWRTEIFEDPALSPWSSRHALDARFAMRATLPGARSFMGGFRAVDDWDMGGGDVCNAPKQD